MKKIKYISVLLYALLVYACTNKINSPEEVSLQKISEIAQLSDTTFISDVRSIYYNKNKFYLSDYKRNQIIILDQKLKFINTIGNTGNGPGELNGASQLYVDNDTLYVINDGKNAIEVFINEKYTNTILFPNMNHLASTKRFSKYKGKIYISNVSSNNNSSIVSFDSQDRMIPFGVLHKYNTPKETIIKNEKHILTYKDKIISISDNVPKIEMYDAKGILITEFDYGDVNLIKEFMTFTNKQKSAENSYFVLVSDAYIFADNLYLMILSLENNKVKSNKILEIKINDNAFKINRILNLGDDWYQSICITNNQLIASNGTITVFSLK
jgi:hypothetical protein